MIEEAYRGRPSAPSYEGAEFFMGVRDTADGSLVNPALRKHTAARMKEEAEIHNERRKAAEENDLRRHPVGGERAHPKHGGKAGKGKGGEASPAEK